jgi:hypothetical protein
VVYPARLLATFTAVAASGAQVSALTSLAKAAATGAPPIIILTESRNPDSYNASRCAAYNPNLRYS